MNHFRVSQLYQGAEGKEPDSLRVSLCEPFTDIATIILASGIAHCDKNPSLKISKERNEILSLGTKKVEEGVMV